MSSAVRSKVWVLDASVCVAWFFTDEPLRAEALSVRSDLRTNPARYVVPPLFYSEMVHVLARKSGHDRAFVTDAMTLLLRFGMRSLSLGEDALRRIGGWVCNHRLSGHDATYLALAEDLGGRWLTSDERAVKQAKSHHALALSDWPDR